MMCTDRKNVLGDSACTLESCGVARLNQWRVNGWKERKLQGGVSPAIVSGRS
jgi:hypothetical protein